MDKLKKLITQGWTITASYEENEFYLTAINDLLGVMKVSIHNNLEIAVNKLYERCEAVNVSTTPSS